LTAVNILCTRHFKSAPFGERKGAAFWLLQAEAVGDIAITAWICTPSQPRDMRVTLNEFPGIEWRSCAELHQLPSIRAEAVM
jgi:hypothetical protein